VADPSQQGRAVPRGQRAEPREPSEPRGPLMSPGFWLHHAALAWRTLFDRRLRPLNLTPTQFMLLSAAGWLAAAADRADAASQPPTQQEVADFAGADRMMTSKVLQTLEERGLIARAPDPGDARLKRLRPTEQGIILIRRGIRIAVDLDDELFGERGDPLRADFERITAKAKNAD